MYEFTKKIDIRSLTQEILDIVPNVGIESYGVLDTIATKKIARKNENIDVDAEIAAGVVGVIIVDHATATPAQFANVINAHDYTTEKATTEKLKNDINKVDHILKEANLYLLERQNLIIAGTPPPPLSPAQFRNDIMDRI